jgi:hypothetical protein
LARWHRLEEITMIARITAVALSLGLVLAMPPTLPASANGAAFFNNSGQISEDGTVYFGIVKNQKGEPVVGANVQIHVKGQNIEYVYQTTTLGRYRSIDLPKDTDPKLVEVIVQKPGFNVLNTDNRTRTSKAGLPVEINFVLSPATG